MKINQLKVGVILSYSSMFLGNLVSIVYTPIMLRLLGQSEYGLYNLVASVVSYLGLLSFGLGSAYIRFYSRYKVNNDHNNIAKLNGMFLIVFSIIGLISVLAGIVFVCNSNFILGNKLSINELATGKLLMAIMVFNIAISFPVIVFDSYITVNEKYVFQKILLIIKTIVSPFLLIPILLMGYKSLGLVIVSSFISIAIGCSNIIFCFKKLKIKFFFKKFNFSLFWEITIFSSFIFISIIIDQINWNVDKFILARFHGTIAVALFSIATQINMNYLSISNAISSVFIPRINRMVAANNDNKELTDLFIRVGRIQFIILMLILSGFIFFGHPFIIMWAGSDYSESYLITLILIISVTIPLIQNLGIEIQRAKNMHKFRSLLYLFIAIGNVFISIPLAKMLGGVGSALGTAIALLIGNGLVMNMYYHIKVGLDIKSFWVQILKIFPSLLFPTLVGILINRFINLYRLIPFLTCICIYTLAFSFSLWFLGMNPFEKDLISIPMLRLLKKMGLSKN